MTATPSRIGAVVLAGGRVPPSLAGHCRHRALLRLGDRLLLEPLLETLAQTPEIVATVTVAPEEALAELRHLPGLQSPSGDTLVENMQRGAHALAAQQPTHLLFITGDIPLVTVESLSAYIAASVASGAALTYPIIPRETCERRFPGARRTYVRLREGTFTGGNAIFTEAHLLNDKHALIQELYTARKQPMKLAGILGWGTITRLLFGTLTLPYIETVATRILDAPARAIVTPYPEIGFDVDKLEDLQAVELALKR